MYTTEEIYAIYLQHPVVCTDTRNITQGAIFFALKGENFNGNRFAEQALKDGCSYAIVDEAEAQTNDRIILVEDVLKALQELAKHHRRQLTIPVIGITGSNGKTTTKELMAAVLSKRYKTFATKGNLNNHIGVPLSILSINNEHEMAIIEMGANHIGEIAALCEIAQPDYGIITNIGRAHLEGFGGPEGVIKAKNELYQYIRKAGGKLFVNQDNQLLVNLSENTERMFYGTSGDVNYKGKFEGASPLLQLKTKPQNDTQSIEGMPLIQTQLIGQYNFENALAAACVGNYFGVSETQIKEALENYSPSNNRSQVLRKGSITIILDAYNANPTSMQAAINNFAEMDAPNKMMILGNMMELGDDTATEHQHIIDLIKQKGLKVMLIGEYFQLVAQENDTTKLFTDVNEAAGWLKSNQPANATLLIKGSRKNQLEKLVEVL